MLQQEVMIEKVRALCEQDERMVAALVYGSFALGQGDRFSDIEFYLFFADETPVDLNEETWVSQIAPLEHYYVNEFGNGTAIFEHLVRGKVHFRPYSKVDLVDSRETAWFPSLEAAVPVDKSGELSRRMSRLVRRPPDLDTPERALFLCRSLMNWTLMVTNLLKRGEYARAEAFLSLVHGHLLKALRRVEGTTANRLSPSRRLEEDVSAASYGRFMTCTAALDARQLARAYTSTWEWSKELMSELATDMRSRFPKRYSTS